MWFAWDCDCSLKCIGTVVNSDGLTWFVYYHSVEMSSRTSCLPNNEVLDYTIRPLCWWLSTFKISHEFMTDCFEAV